MAIRALHLTIVPHALAVAAAVMVLVWCIYFRGGLAWASSNKNLIFNRLLRKYHLTTWKVCYWAIEWGLEHGASSKFPFVVAKFGAASSMLIYAEQGLKPYIRDVYYESPLRNKLDREKTKLKPSLTMCGSPLCCGYLSLSMGVYGLLRPLCSCRFRVVQGFVPPRDVFTSSFQGRCV
ncbi:hypothetical protein QQP08_011335 [Theobroma cacao]|nr:hypothetical protein QQP08_011335 [Theobroma cacao]